MENNIIAKGVKYIGVDDLDLDLFEGQYAIPQGVSYNSYLIDDEKITIMDTVDERKTEEWLQRLETELAGRKPTYLVVSHLEPDHASNVKRIMDMFPECVALCSAKAVPMLARFFGTSFSDRVRVVKEGDTVSTGEHTLQFFMAPMVHWPEVMVTYEHSQKILFSADGFGTFGAVGAHEEWACEARRYYFNICGKYGASVQALLKKAAGLDIQIICPLHGPVLSENLGYYIDKYNTWSKYEVESKGVFIAYCSLHGNTETAALKLAETLQNEHGEKVVVADLRRCDMSEAIEDAFRYDRLVLAAPTYDAGVMPVMEDFINHLKAKAYQNRKVGFIENGSWAPVAGKKMREAMEAMKNMTIVEPLVTVESAVKEKTLEDLKTLAAALIG
ncbi:MAG: FprA family A-type flavoprotein [Bacteroides sp.]|nr:FprA family A-type flavoprotein [Roseburia sp.]MCM1347352.1 FprA family A-type flavoprotein [Bacteroides sp.]MCM1421389.1 FprA family A-type flavoprotein [Bacteroides sp.]